MIYVGGGYRLHTRCCSFGFGFFTLHVLWWVLPKAIFIFYISGLFNDLQFTLHPNCHLNSVPANAAATQRWTEPLACRVFFSKRNKASCEFMYRAYSPSSSSSLDCVLYNIFLEAARTTRLQR